MLAPPPTDRLSPAAPQSCSAGHTLLAAPTGLANCIRLPQMQMLMLLLLQALHSRPAFGTENELVSRENCQVVCLSTSADVAETQKPQV